MRKCRGFREVTENLTRRARGFGWKTSSAFTVRAEPDGPWCSFRNGHLSSLASTPDRSYHHALMPTFVLIAIVWVVLPVIVYRMVNATSGSMLLSLAAAAASVIVVVLVLERGFRVGKALLQARRARRDTFS